MTIRELLNKHVPIDAEIVVDRGDRWITAEAAITEGQVDLDGNIRFFVVISPKPRVAACTRA